MSILPEIDEKKTKKNVEDLLSQYCSLVRYAREEFEPSITVTYKLEMTSQTNVINQPIEDAVVKQIAAEQVLNNINRAFNKLSADTRQRLFEKYMGREKLNNQELAIKHNESDSKFYRSLGRALLEFAEAYCSGELQVNLK